MRLTEAFGIASPEAQAVLQTLAIGAAALFLLIILPQAVDYTNEQSFIETPALGLSDAVRAGALPVGCALMVLLALYLTWRVVQLFT